MSSFVGADKCVQILLPFAEREWISVDRTCKILGVSVATLYRLREERDERGDLLIETIDYGRNCRQRVLYASVVRFCDYLREKYYIRDRRAPLTHPIFRHKDEELLPFPLSDTITTFKALQYLGYETERPLYHRIEEGSFEAYRLFPRAPSFWRISASSLAAWIESCRSGSRR